MPLQIPETRYAKSGDVSIAYQVLGEGPIDVVLIPGFISNVELAWEEPACPATGAYSRSSPLSSSRIVLTARVTSRRFPGSFSQLLAPEGWGRGITVASPSA